MKKAALGSKCLGSLEFVCFFVCVRVNKQKENVGENEEKRRKERETTFRNMRAHRRTLYLYE